MRGRRRKPDKCPSAEEVRALLDYEPGTGAFRWRSAKRGVAARARAGSIQKNGYRIIGINNTKFYAGTLAWFHMTGEWPTVDVDHKNRSRADDRWANLRLASRGQNMANSRRHADNRSGLKGIWRSPDGRWETSIYVNGKKIWLGRYRAREAAHAAYCEAAHKFRGEFAFDGNAAA